jgi:peptide chain release factor 1
LVEIQAEAGGDDAKQFASELAAAYSAYFHADPLEEATCSFGYSAFLAKGHQVAWFMTEVGLHCVQRVPRTERDGRRHTSFARVTVRPIAASAPRLREEDVELIFQRGRGPGGQAQNKVSSAVRARHRPTGLSVFINGRSQGQNRETAVKVLASRVAEHMRDASAGAAMQTKKNQSAPQAKIRTINLIENRAVDHRTGLKVCAADRIMQGEFDLIRR